MKIFIKENIDINSHIHVYMRVAFIKIKHKQKNKKSVLKYLVSEKQEIYFKSKKEKMMKIILSNEDDEMISLEFICEEIKEQLKLILALIERYKKENSHLKQQQFKAKKQVLFQILHESSSNLVEVT